MDFPFNNITFLDIDISKNTKRSVLYNVAVRTADIFMDGNELAKYSYEPHNASANRDYPNTYNHLNMEK